MRDGEGRGAALAAHEHQPTCSNATLHTLPQLWWDAAPTRQGSSSVAKTQKELKTWALLRTAWILQSPCKQKDTKIVCPEIAVASSAVATALFTRDAKAGRGVGPLGGVKTEVFRCALTGGSGLGKVLLADQQGAAHGAGCACTLFGLKANARGQLGQSPDHAGCWCRGRGPENHISKWPSLAPSYLAHWQLETRKSHGFVLDSSRMCGLGCVLTHLNRICEQHHALSEPSPREDLTR